MRNIIRFAFTFGVVGAACGQTYGQAPVTDRAPATEKSVVYKAGEDGYNTYRIPAIVRAANRDLLAFAEGRKNGRGDHGDIDIVLKRSSDGQVLVLHDLLGITSGYLPRFVKAYADLKTDITRAITQYREEVRSGAFPDKEHGYE